MGYSQQLAIRAALLDGKYKTEVSKTGRWKLAADQVKVFHSMSRAEQQQVVDALLGDKATGLMSYGPGPDGRWGPQPQQRPPSANDLEATLQLMEASVEQPDFQQVFTDGRLQRMQTLDSSFGMRFHGSRSVQARIDSALRSHQSAMKVKPPSAGSTPVQLKAVDGKAEGVSPPHKSVSPIRQMLETARQRSVSGGGYQDASAKQAIQDLLASKPNGETFTGDDILKLFTDATKDLDAQAAGAELADLKKFAEAFGDRLSDTAQAMLDKYFALGDKLAAQASRGIPQDQWDALQAEMAQMAAAPAESDRLEAVFRAADPTSPEGQRAIIDGLADVADDPSQLHELSSEALKDLVNKVLSVAVEFPDDAGGAKTAAALLSTLIQSADWREGGTGMAEMFGQEITDDVRRLADAFDKGGHMRFSDALKQAGPAFALGTVRAQPKMSARHAVDMAVYQGTEAAGAEADTEAPSSAPGRAPKPEDPAKAGRAPEAAVQAGEADSSNGAREAAPPSGASKAEGKDRAEGEAKVEGAELASGLKWSSKMFERLHALAKVAEALKEEAMAILESGGEINQSTLMLIQEKISQANQILETINNINKGEHDLNDGIIRNIG